MEEFQYKYINNTKVTATNNELTFKDGFGDK